MFRVLADLAGSTLESAEGTWNLGIGFLAVVDPTDADEVAARLAADGIPAWRVGTVVAGAELAGDGWVVGAKGVDGGAVRLVGAYAD